MNESNEKMVLPRIGSADLAGKGVVGLPAAPGLEVSKMQKKLDELVLDVVVPKFNQLAGDIETLNHLAEGEYTEELKAVLELLQINGISYAQNGFDTYTHQRTDQQHQLTGNGATGGNIKFVAMADFKDGDTFTVNGEAKTAQTQDGEPLSGGFFKSGAVVTAFLNDDTLNFKSGGAGLNFKVVGSTTQPESPAENTVWVNTDTAIGGWVFSAAEPSELSEGLVWIKTGASSPAAFSAVSGKTVMVYPLNAKQYVGDAWVKKTAQSYIGNEWVNWAVVVYKAGTFGEFGFAKGANSGSSTSSYTQYDTFIQLHANGSTSYIFARTESPAQLDGISTINFNGGIWCDAATASQTGGAGARAHLCVSASADFSSIIAETEVSTEAISEQAVSLSLPVSLKGSFYIAIKCDRNGAAGTRKAYCNIYNLSME